MPSNPDHTHSRLTGSLTALAVLTLGVATIHQGWHFHASYQPSHGDPNILGTGWLLQMVFFVLNRIPSVVLGGATATLGGISLLGHIKGARKTGDTPRGPAVRPGAGTL